MKEHRDRVRVLTSHKLEHSTRSNSSKEYDNLLVGDMRLNALRGQQTDRAKTSIRQSQACDNRKEQVAARKKPRRTEQSYVSE